jgi:hypothetical protein
MGFYAWWPSRRQATDVRIVNISCAQIFGQGMSHLVPESGVVRNVAKSMTMVHESGLNFLSQTTCDFVAPQFLLE